MLTWLNKPYYFNNSTAYKILVCLCFGLTIFLFLLIFQPFRLKETDHPILYSLGFGIVTFSALFITHFIFPKLFSSFFAEESWVIWKQIIFGLSSILLISFGNGLFRSYFFWEYEGGFSESIFLYLYQTFVVGFFPIVLFVLLDERYTRKKRSKNAKRITNDSIKKDLKIETPPLLLKLYSENEKDYLEILLKNLLYITSQKNYVSFFILDEKSKEIKEQILRVSLKKVELSFEPYKEFIKCHRSYIVNTFHMDALKGNARNYYLESSFIDFDIPVSRSYPVKELKKLIG